MRLPDCMPAVPTVSRTASRWATPLPMRSSPCARGDGSEQPHLPYTLAPGRAFYHLTPPASPLRCRGWARPAFGLRVETNRAEPVRMLDNNKRTSDFKR